MVQGGYCGVRAVGALLCSGCWAAPWDVTPAPGMRVCFSFYAHAARRQPTDAAPSLRPPLSTQPWLLRCLSRPCWTSAHMGAASR